jgi:hypothetical protein
MRNLLVTDKLLRELDDRIEYLRENTGDTCVFAASNELERIKALIQNEVFDPQIWE